MKLLAFMFLFFIGAVVFAAPTPTPTPWGHEPGQVSPTAMWTPPPQGPIPTSSPTPAAKR